MTTGTVQYKGYTSGTGPSPAIWADCPVESMLTDPDVGVYFFDDFLASAGVTGAPYDWTGSNDNPAILADALGGVVRLTPTGTANDQTILHQLGDPVTISDTAAESRKLWFEARVRVSSITTAAWFVGLAASADAIADFIANGTGSIASTADFIGFRVLDDDLDGLDWAYQIGGQTAQVKLNPAQVLAITTWYKVGFVYDPNGIKSQPSSNKIACYIDGVEQTTYITAANIAAATFPDSINMGLFATAKVGTFGAAGHSLDIDWWRLAQMRIPT